LEKRKQEEADAINAAEFPAWAGRENVPAYVAHWLTKPQLPPRRRPRRRRCPLCGFSFAVKKRGPIPLTCSYRCALALKLYRAAKTLAGQPVKLIERDIVAHALLDQRRTRHQALINDLLDRIKTGMARKPRDPER
jgi:hypothetical protein